ncbi:MAG TPA: Ger(x)C family spore germination protein [Symbiobacteriaceae bacterium]|nr:Ger(x)C family spore germination protein [Symbiobacteriaceae bacterium]
MRRRLAALGLAAVLLLAGCWDARSLDQRAFVIMLGIDTTSGGRFRVTMQMQRAGYEQQRKGTAGGMNAARVVASDGDTLRQAVERVRDDLSRELDTTFLDVLVLSREVATERMEELDWIVRTFRIPISSFVVVTPGEAEAVVRAKATGHPMPAQFALFALMQGSWTRSPAIVQGFMWMVFNRNWFTPLEDPFAPVLSTTEGQLSWHGLAVFRGHRLAGMLSEQDASTFNMLLGGRAERTLTADLPGGGKATLYLQTAKVKRWVTWEQGGPVIHVRIRTQGDLQELIHYHAHTEQEEIVIESALSRQLEKEVRMLMKDMQQLDSDPIGFGELARQAAPYRREVQSGEAWKKVYREARIDVRAGVTMIAPGYMK